MLERLAQFVLSFLLDKLFGFITKQWDEYKQDKEKKEELKKKVKAIKDAKTKEELRSAVRDLSI